MDFYLRFEAKRREQPIAIRAEIDAKLNFPLGDGSLFTLTARADRIETGAGGLTLVDYKTGAPPSNKEILLGFAPQLTLEAAMARRGGFGFDAQTSAVEALYVKLGGKEGGRATPVAFAREKRDFTEVAEEHFAALKDLLNQFRDPACAYPSRPFPQFAAKYGAYDHLARVKEWSLGGGDEGE